MPEEPTQHDSPIQSSTRRQRWLALALMIGCLGCDQASKQVAIALLPEGRRLSMLGDVFRLELIRNPGAFLGLGGGLAGSMWAVLFTWGVAVIVLLAGGAALFRRMPARHAIGAALIAGGGLGNLVDRLRVGGLVTDFMNLGIGSLRTGIFNVADLAIMAGIGLLLVGNRASRDGRPTPASS